MITRPSRPRPYHCFSITLAVAFTIASFAIVIFVIVGAAK